MALTVTSLNGAITAGARYVRLTAFTNPSTGAIGPNTVLVADGEKMLVTDATLSPTLQVVRGYDQTFATPHNTLAPVTYGLTSDYSQTVGQGGIAGLNEYSIGVNDSNVTLPIVDSTVYFTKATALAITINGPAKDQTNTIRFVSLTAAAHTVTYTAGFYANTTSSDVATFPATAGAVFTIVARNGVWNAVATADDGVTIG